MLDDLDRLFLEGLNSKLYPHASNILTKNSRSATFTNAKREAFPRIVEQYLIFLRGNNAIVGFSDENIISRTHLLNNYYNFIEQNNYHNIFTFQGKFRPTILEEFMYMLLKDFIEEKRQLLPQNNRDYLKIGTKAYTNLFFSGNDFLDFINNPTILVNEKNQDFAIYRPFDITINGIVKQIKIPIVSIENKTYLDKTMLDGAIATAEKIKSGNPYAKYFVVAEDYDVRYEVDPAYSKIDQIYVLRKRKKNEASANIYSSVFIDLVNEIDIHLNKTWGNIQHKLNNYGKII